MSLAALAALALLPLAPTPEGAGPKAPLEATVPAPDGSAPAVVGASRLLTLELVDKGVGAETAALLSQAFAEQARASHVGELVSQRELKAQLAVGALGALAGCESPACMGNYASTVGAERVLGGSAAIIGDDVLLTVLLIEAATGKRLYETQRKVPNVAALLRYAAQNLAAMALTGRPALANVPVEVSADQEGATLVVDGEEHGPTPKVLSLAPGPHELRVLKDGYPAWRTLITVEEATPLSLHATLVAARVPLWPAAAAAGAVSLLAAGGGLVAGLFALDSYDGSVGLTPEARDRSYLHVSPVDEQGLAAARQRTEQLEYVGYALFATAGVAAAAAIGLTAADLALSLE